MRKAKGGDLFVHLWASWCGPCLEELPDIDCLARQARARGAVFLSVSLDDPKRAAHVLDVLHRRAPNLTRFVAKLDDPDKFAELFSGEWDGSIPALFVYDRSRSPARELRWPAGERRHPPHAGRHLRCSARLPGSRVGHRRAATVSAGVKKSDSPKKAVTLIAPLGLVRIAGGEPTDRGSNRGALRRADDLEHDDAVHGHAGRRVRVGGSPEVLLGVKVPDRR